MLGMADEQPGDDMRLLCLAYIESLVREDSPNTEYLERDSRVMARSMGRLAWYLMDAAVIPLENGVNWRDGWVEVDFRSRTDPRFKANLTRRGRYRRMAKGYTLRPRHRLRHTAVACMDMLCAAYVLKYGRRPDVTHREAVLEMLAYFRRRFCQMGDTQRNA
jgi:hypothetical protein